MNAPILENPHQLRSFLGLVNYFRFGYRSTPHSTTGRSPSSLFLGRELRTRLDLLMPNCEEHVLSKQSKQAQQHNQHAKPRCFEVGQQIMAHNYGPGPKWHPAVVKSRLGPVTLFVETDHSQTWKRHHDQLRSTQLVPDPTTDSSDDVLAFDQPPHPVVTTSTTAPSSLPCYPPFRYGTPLGF